MTTKAKRRLFNFDFSKDGAHVALVSKKQGGPANNIPLLVAKSLKSLPQVANYTKVQKALEQITVTLSMEEFLRKFFDMWYDDAEMLTKLLGFETEYEYYQSQSDKEVYDHSTYLEERVGKFQIMKSLRDGENIEVAAEDFIEILTLQEKVEKALEGAPQHNEDNPLEIKVEKARYEQLEEQAQQTEVAVAKAAQLEIEKASLTAELEAAKAEVEVMKAAKVEAELNDIKAQLEGTVEAEQIEALAKSLHVMEASAREIVISTMVAKAKAAEDAVANSDLMREVSNADEVTVEKSAKELQEERFLEAQRKIAEAQLAK